LFAIADRLKPSQRDELGTSYGPITEELSNLRTRLAALSGIQDAAGSNTMMSHERRDDRAERYRRLGPLTWNAKHPVDESWNTSPV